MEPAQRRADFLSALLGESPEITLVIDPTDMSVLQASMEAARALGYALDDLLGAHVPDLDALVPGAPEMWDHMVRSIPEGATATFESRLLRRDGTTFPAEVKVRNLVYDGDLFVIAVAHDATHRIEAEDQLRRREAGLAKVIAAMKDGIIVVDKDCTVTMANPRAAELCSMKREEMIGESAGCILAMRVDEEGRPIPGERGPLGRTLRSGDPVLDEVQGVPLPDGTVRWLLVNTAPILHPDTGAIEGAIATNSDITELVRTQGQLEALANRDPLTDLPNRGFFFESLDVALAAARCRGDHLALLFLDLDGFKTVNDSLGHSQGDLILQETGKRLHVHLRPGDFLARLGGDEFVILLPGLGPDRAAAGAQAASIAEAACSQLSRPFSLDRLTVKISVSVGIALFSGGDEDAERLVRHADLAMYAAKDAGRGSHRFFEPHMNERVQSRLLLDTDLRGAIDNNEFELYLQPQVSTTTGRVLGAECLLRWNRTGPGPSDPTSVIDAAERNGLIVPIGRWVLDEACRLARRLLDDGVFDSESVLAVNVSGMQFQLPDFVESIEFALRRSGLPGSTLVIELTESSLVRDLEAARDCLHALADLGVRLSIDDFGTGYSSLAYLRRLPLHELKIDRSFVHDIEHDTNARTIVEAVVALADALGLRTVAEGVETDAQLAFLRRLGCGAFQGFLVSPPVPLWEYRRHFGASAEINAIALA